MLNEVLMNQLPAAAAFHRGAELKNYTTFQLGGACPALIECPDADTLALTAVLLAEHDIDFMVIGQGSNLLVSDAGLDQVVLRYCSEQ